MPEFRVEFRSCHPNKIPEFHVEIPSWQANKFLNFPPKFGGTEATCAVKYEIATIRRAG